MTTRPFQTPNVRSGSQPKIAASKKPKILDYWLTWVNSGRLRSRRPSIAASAESSARCGSTTTTTCTDAPASPSTGSTSPTTRTAGSGPRPLAAATSGWSPRIGRKPLGGAFNPRSYMASHQWHSSTTSMRYLPLSNAAESVQPPSATSGLTCRFWLPRLVS